MTQNTGYWIGLRQDVNGAEPDEGWGWVTGESLDFTNWNDPEPNNVGNEDCGELTANGPWNDNACVELRYFVVEVAPHAGCTDQMACNYDPEANVDDGSCELSGCLDDEACNFNAEAACDDGSCDYSCCPGPGCCTEGMYWDWELSGCYNINPADINFDGCVQLNDLLDLLSAYGDCGAEESQWQCGDPLEYQGYDYETVQIGSQCWFAENLRAENYRNGDVIPADLNDSEWAETTEGAVSIYDGDMSNLNAYGRLYNWYAVDDDRSLCPIEWRVPDNIDWVDLEIHLGMAEEEAIGTGWRGSDQGFQLKSDFGWSESGNGINSSQFGAFPAGGRDGSGFYGVGSFGAWWSNSPNGNLTWLRSLDDDKNGVNASDNVDPFKGFSIRCIKE